MAKSGKNNKKNKKPVFSADRSKKINTYNSKEMSEREKVMEQLRALGYI